MVLITAYLWQIKKTFGVILSTEDAKTMNVRIKADSFRVPGGEGGSYIFEAPGTIVAAFTRESVLGG
jgi:hypothetical protein